MQAIVYTEYGPPERLQLREVATPAPADDEILIAVRAASVNSWDWDLLRGRPFITRMSGLLKPKHQILGGDVAGTVVAMGKNVTQFQPGAEVFGDVSEHGWGGFAEYVTGPATAFVLKPPGMSFAQAAAIPQAGGLALQGLRDKRQILPGDEILINGAGGGAGTFAIQIAKSYGAHVTGVDSAAKFDLMRSLGAEHVIDYSHQDYTQIGRRYDLILDMVANRPLSAYRRALSPTGAFVLIGGSTATILQTVTLGSWRSRRGQQQLGLLAWTHRTSDLEHFKAQFAAGKVTPVIDRTFTLAETAQALRYMGAGLVQGKIVVTV